MPDCSASEMNSSGETWPKVGWVQRARASSAMMRRVGEAHLRLEGEVQAVASMAWRRSPARHRRRVLEWSIERSYSSTPLRRSLAAYMAMSACWNRILGSRELERRQRHADADLHLERELIDHERRVDLRLDGAGERDRLLAGCQAGHHEAELVAAQAGDEAPPPDDADSRRATSISSRSPVWWPRVSLTSLNRSRSMKNTPTRASSPLPWQELLEPGHEQLAVGEAGERVVQGRELLLGRLRPQPVHEIADAQGDGGVAGERLEHLHVLGVERADLAEAVGDQQRARRAVVAGERRGDDVAPAPLGRARCAAARRAGCGGTAPARRRASTSDSSLRGVGGAVDLGDDLIAVEALGHPAALGQGDDQLGDLGAHQLAGALERAAQHVVGVGGPGDRGREAVEQLEAGVAVAEPDEGPQAGVGHADGHDDQPEATPVVPHDRDGEDAERRGDQDDDAADEQQRGRALEAAQRRAR